MEELVIEVIDQHILHPEPMEAEQTHPEAGAEGHMHHPRGRTQPHQVYHLKGTDTFNENHLLNHRPANSNHGVACHHGAQQPTITMEVEVGKQPDSAWYGALE